MDHIANRCEWDKPATRQADNRLCIIVGWRRIVGEWADIHNVVANGSVLIREGGGYRLVYSEAVMQGVRS